jgi:2-methylcitrate dehydratase PrpD
MTQPNELASPLADGPAWAAARWLAAARDLALPPDVVAAARTCLIDWFACTLGGSREPVVGLVRRRLASWSPTGSAPLLTGGSSAPAFAALLHSTAAHTTDFDDTHIWTDAHFSGPTWAAVLAQLRNDVPADDGFLCKAFVAGFETGTKLGGRRLGHAMVHRGFQATAMLGRLSGAAACAVIAGLDANRIAMALALAGCQTAGLSTAAGSMMKPFQGGKTASDAVIAAELAADGFAADPDLFDPGGGAIGSQRIGGLARAFVQDGFAEFAHPDFAAGWEILRNSTKAYPCLHGIGPVIDAARDLQPRIAGRRVVRVRAYVGPSVPKIARYDRPRTSHEGRFSIQYCAVLGLLGRPFATADFEPAFMHSPEVQRLVGLVELVPTEGRKMYNAAVDVTLESGEVLLADVPLGRGHPGRPLSASELEAKFRLLVEPVLGGATTELLCTLEAFPRNGTISRAFDIARRWHPDARVAGGTRT